MTNSTITVTDSTSDDVMMGIQMGMWSGVLTAIVLYKIIRSVLALNDCFEWCA